MRKVIDILRLKHEAGLSHEKIGCVVGLSKGAVGKYVNLAKAVGITWPLPPDVDEAQLESMLLRGQDKPASKFAQPDLPRIHQELKRKGLTLQLLWAEYAEAHGASAYRYSQFCFHYQRWRQRQKRSMRQLHRAGEKLFIDYCGPTVPIVHATTGELRQAQVFVAVLGASSYTYAEATWTQELPQWIASHQRAFAFFGGVVELLVPDNLLSGVTKACRYDPQPNATYQELARHYGKARLEAACERALAIHSPSYRSLATSSSRGSIASPWPGKRPSRGSCPCTPMSAVPVITTDSPPSRGTHHVASAHPG